MACADSLRLQAYFDGELDALATAQVEQHLDQCADCRAQLEDLSRMRLALRKELSYATAPAALRARVLKSLDIEAGPIRRPVAFWRGALSGACATALAAGLASLMLWPPAVNPLLDAVVDAHVRSLMPNHLIDVVSTDQHTVKPWFSGNADVSPVVADFDSQGYRLVGGRADFFDRQRAAAVVYEHGRHVINVFSWADANPPLPSTVTRNGYHLACWKSGNLQTCAISDTGWEELAVLVTLLKDTSAQENRAARE